MPDEIDIQQERDAVLGYLLLQRIREQAARIPIGAPGVCILCENESKRLVNEICAPCRDKHGLP